MSLYATISTSDDASGDRDGGDVATNSGWSDFGRWVEMWDGIDELIRLSQHGQSEDGPGLVVAIDAALADCEPTPDQRSIAKGLRRIAAKMQPGDVLTISDGVGVDESDEEMKPW